MSPLFPPQQQPADKAALVSEIRRRFVAEQLPGRYLISPPMRISLMCFILQVDSE